MTDAQFRTFLKRQIEATSVQSVASQFGVSRQTIFNWKEKRVPPNEMAIIIAKLLVQQNASQSR